MPKKPVMKNKSSVKKKKPRKSGPCGHDSPRNYQGPRKLKS